MPSATNIGTRPTFNGSSVTVETHVIGADMSSTPPNIEIHFLKRLRCENKFNSPEELRLQIAKDLSATASFCRRLNIYRQLGVPTPSTANS
jgi:riboflavin kinase/FMN adenylyltransferase